MSKSSIAYRPDIDGLRAIAVLAVLVFHGFPDKLRGGFVGVDIFFVISGFLISAIILKELDEGRFTIANFYARRISRIFPSLLLVLAVVMLFGWIVLLPDEFVQLTRHTIGGTAFVSNILFWRQSGYFDTAAQSKPLLHLWSLGIEEQFYIAWPLLLAFLYRHTPKILRWICLGILASFALNILLIGPQPIATFYLPFTRAWELLIGGALAHYSFRRRQVPQTSSTTIPNLCATVGAVLILLSLAFVTEDRFPGWYALLPTLGTALLINGGGSWINRNLLAAPVMVAIGLISYPLYLWHWPVLTFFRLIVTTDLHLSKSQLTAARLGILAICVLLAWLTTRFWETPLRESKRIGRSVKVRGLAAAMAVLTLLAVLPAAGLIRSRLSDPTTMHLAQAIDDWEYLPVDNQYKSDFRTNEIRSRSAQSTLFVGDSHINQYWSRAKADIAAHPELSSALFDTYPGCPPVPALNRKEPGYRCPQFYEWWREQAAAPAIHTVVIGAYWEVYFLGAYDDPSPEYSALMVNAAGSTATTRDFDAAWHGLENTIASLVHSGKRVLILSSSPASPNLDPHRAFHRFRGAELSLLRPVDLDRFHRFTAPIDAQFARIAADTGAIIVRPTDYFCHDGICPAVDATGSPYYKDADHLRATTVLQRAAFIDTMLQPCSDSDSLCRTASAR